MISDICVSVFVVCLCCICGICYIFANCDLCFVFCVCFICFIVFSFGWLVGLFVCLFVWICFYLCVFLFVSLCFFSLFYFPVLPAVANFYLFLVVSLGKKAEVSSLSHSID